ncbi:MAG: molybdenum cofactor biosynthesis protein MoaE [Fuerstiella sp.]|jgi:molybdopterin synthase catalytic subunit|nr:molybdenum cofactor biosynthesis protein MoaE [Fuerstiella sp.]
MIKFTTDAIDYNEITESVRSHAAGAVVLFLGTVREFTGGVQTSALVYDAYPVMAQQELQHLETDVREKWPVIDVAIVHRTGALKLGDIAVAVAVSSEHRREAFAAGQWLIDTLKVRVPVWKKELYANGETEWVHSSGQTVATSTADESDLSGAES